jgi:hypothetical protein
VGYALTIVKGPDCAVDAITAIIGRHVPESKMTSNVGAELSFRLPLASSAAFPALFSELEAGQAVGTGGDGAGTPVPGALGFSSYGISVTSLEDVFLKVAEESDGGRPPGLVDTIAPSPTADGAADGSTLKPGAGASLLGDAAARASFSAPGGRYGSAGGEHDLAGRKLSGIGGTTSGSGSTGNSGVHTFPSDVDGGWDVFWGHFRALFLKRFRIALRDRRAQVFQVLIPVLALGAGLALLKTGATSAFPPMPLTLAVYNPKMPGVGAGGKQANFVPWVADAAGAGLLPFIAGAGAAPGGANAGIGAAYGASFVPLDAGIMDAQYGWAAYTAYAGGPDVLPCNTSVPPYNPLDGMPLPYLQYLYPSPAFANNVSHMWGLSQWLLDHRNGSEGTGSPGDLAREYGATRYGAFRLESVFPNPAAGPLPAGAGAYVGYQVLTNTSGWHALPTFINVLHSGLLAWVTGSNASSISVTNAPLPFTAAQATAVQSIQSFVAVLLMVIAVAFIPPTFAVQIVKEREVGARHQQLVRGLRAEAWDAGESGDTLTAPCIQLTHLNFFSSRRLSCPLHRAQISGVSLPSYWLSTYLWDMTNYMVRIGRGRGR